MWLAQRRERIHPPEHLAGWLAAAASRECLRVLAHLRRLVERRAVRSTDPAFVGAGW